MLDIAMIAMAKMEELYIKDWIDYHINLGILHFYIIDNNDPDYDLEKQLDNVLINYINNTVTLIDAKNINREYNVVALSRLYNKVFLDIYMLYDYIVIIDIDEYIHIQGNYTLHDLLLLDLLKNADTISLITLIFNDNNLVYYDKRPVYERFLLPANYMSFGIKTIVKGKNPNIYINSAHCPKLKNFNLTDIFGKPLRNKNTNTNLDKNYYSIEYILNMYNIAYIKHFKFKTIDEFFNYRLKRNYWSYFFNDLNDILKKISFELFFRFNDITIEKMQYALKYNQEIYKIQENYISEYSKALFNKAKELNIQTENINIFKTISEKIEYMKNIKKLIEKNE